MLERAEVERSLRAAWDLFLDRPDAMDGFDLSEEGFWRSFRAIALVVPLFVLGLLAQLRLTDTWAQGLGFWVLNGILLVLDWFAFPLLLALVAGPLGIGRRYAAFIIARNWASVWAYALMGAISFLVVLGLIGPESGMLLIGIAWLVVLYYAFIVARRGLEAGILLAVGVVIADTALSLTLSQLIDWLAGG